ncbi:MAG: bifunctional DNA primase/polymerase [Kofleriaceae bacterium]|nr:bifunctional DNA primase/polymerase [Kofleriaceae bacterium]
MLEHALDYARRGWLVVPQRAKDRPIRGWLQLATIDEPTIKSWFSGRPIPTCDHHRPVEQSAGH